MASKSEIKELRDRIKRDREPLVKLSAALGALDEMLRSRAKGYSLHSLYPEGPEILRGYVELVYDLNNHPSFRLFESLLYRSEFYDHSQQSLMLSAIRSDDRPFILSTPRLESEDRFHLQACFSDPVVDELFRLKKVPRPWDEIRELLRVSSGTRRPGPFILYGASPAAFTEATQDQECGGVILGMHAFLSSLREFPYCLIRC